MDTWIRLGVLAILAPLWWPVVKALYSEIDQALWKEGGLFGRKLSATEIERMARHPPESENQLVSEPWAEYRRRMERRGTEAAAPGARASSGPIRSSRRRGF
jgi:hypothetical protein